MPLFLIILNKAISVFRSEKNNITTTKLWIIERKEDLLKTNSTSKENTTELLTLILQLYGYLYAVEHEDRWKNNNQNPI